MPCVCARVIGHTACRMWRAERLGMHLTKQSQHACERSHWSGRVAPSSPKSLTLRSRVLRLRAMIERERWGGGGRGRETETEGDRDRDRQRWIETKKDREDVSQRSESACRTAGPVTNGSEETKAHGAKANGHSRERKAQLHTALSKLEQGKTNSHRLEAPTERRQSLEHAVGRKGGIHCSSGSP